MESLNIKTASDEKLEDIIRKAENTHVSGSSYERAKIELEIRRNKRLFESQDKLL